MWKQFIRDTSIILVGSFLLAAGIFHINAQNNLSEGGFLGVALIFKHLFDISPSITTLMLDVPIFLLGIKMFGRNFIIKSFIGAFSFSAFYSLFENYSNFSVDLTNYMFVAAILAGIFTGIGLGLIIRAGGTTGGDDVLTIVVKSKTKLTMGQVYFIFDAIILLLSLVYLEWSEFGYTLLTVAVSAKVTDLVIELGVDEDNDTSNTLNTAVATV